MSIRIHPVMPRQLNGHPRPTPRVAARARGGAGVYRQLRPPRFDRSNERLRHKLVSGGACNSEPPRPPHSLVIVAERLDDSQGVRMSAVAILLTSRNLSQRWLCLGPGQSAPRTQVQAIAEVARPRVRAVANLLLHQSPEVHGRDAELICHLLARERVSTTVPPPQ
jgi:hypothetical protein